MFPVWPLTHIYVVQVLKTCEVFKNEEGKAFGLLLCWNVLRYEEKWKEACANKKEKTTPNASPGASTPPSSENNCGNEQDCASQSTEHTNARPDGRKKEKERLRKGKNPLPSAENLYMDAMENLWATFAALLECHDRYIDDQPQSHPALEHLYPHTACELCVVLKGSVTMMSLNERESSF